MDREELLKLHAALGSLLALPDNIRALLAQWLEASKPNGHDHHPPATPPTPPLRPAKAAFTAQGKSSRKSTFSAKTAERKLLEAMAANPASP
jgi:hypothetical protein